MRIIDMRTHVWDLPSAEFPWHAPVKPLTYGRVRNEPPGQPSTESQLLSPSFAQSVAPAEMLLRFMDWAEVERAAILPSFLHGFDNRYIAACAKRWPDRFWGFGAVDLMSDELLSQASLAVDGLGLHGLYGWPTDGERGVWFDDHQLTPFWKQVERWGVPVTMHISTLRRRADLLGWPHLPHQAYYHQIAQLGRVAEQHPRVRILIDHLGDPVVDEEPPHRTYRELLSLARFPDFFLKISALSYFSQQEFPYVDVHAFIRKAAGAFGPDRLLWGSDFPGTLLRCTYRQTIDSVRTACDQLGDEAQAAIFGGAAASLMDPVSPARPDTRIG